MRCNSILKSRHVVAFAVLVCFVVIYSPVSALGQNKVAETKPLPLDPNLKQLPPPPKIISTFPAVGATDVDPELTEISLTFDQDMLDGYSFFPDRFTKGYYPKHPEGKTPFWRDKRTCVLPATLEEGKFYCINFNYNKNSDFRSIYDQRLNETQLYFTTRGASEEVQRYMIKPSIVHIEPANGAQDVDPNTKEIRVTFDMEMSYGYAWSVGAPDGADLDSKEYYIANQHFLRPYESIHWTVDRKTCVYTLKQYYQTKEWLASNKEYKFRLNSQYSRGFKSKYGVSMDSYLCTFRTTIGKDVEAIRPQVIHTSPAIGASNVDPELSEITVTFDQDMDTQSHFWWGANYGAFKDFFPVITDGSIIIDGIASWRANTFWRDKRTCVLPVTLEPGKYYGVGINFTFQYLTKEYEWFRSAEGIRPPTTAIYFTTEGASEEVLKRMEKPRLIKCEPANGAQGVDPNLTEIRFTFDVEMTKGTMNERGISLHEAGPYHAREFDKFPYGKSAYWTDDRKTLVKSVMLEPNKEYKLQINNVFSTVTASKWGVPLDITTYTFTTGPERNEEK